MQLDTLKYSELNWTWRWAQRNDLSHGLRWLRHKRYHRGLTWSSEVCWTIPTTETVVCSYFELYSITTQSISGISCVEAVAEIISNFTDNTRLVIQVRRGVWWYNGWVQHIQQQWFFVRGAVNFVVQLELVQPDMRSNSRQRHPRLFVPRFRSSESLISL